MATYSSNILPIQEREALSPVPNRYGVIDYTDLSGTAATTLVLTLCSYAARDVIGSVQFDVITPFVGTSITALKLDIGYDGASVDLQTAFVNQAEVLSAASGTVVAGAGLTATVNSGTVGATTYDAATSAVISSLRTITNDRNARLFAAQEAGNITALFTATGANLSALTAGRLRYYFSQHNLPAHRTVSNQ